jgi:NADH-quinone oxidoreductase subunit L
VLPESVGHAGGEAKHSLEIASGAIAIAGILLAALLFLGKRRFVTPSPTAASVASCRPGGSPPGASTGSTTNCSSNLTC